MAEERIELKGTGAVYKLKSKWNDGTSSIVLSGPEFIEKLVAIVPQPRIHLTRFHGVLAPHSSLREAVVPAKKPVLEAAKSQRSDRIGWSALLRRVFDVDLSKCARCGGQVRFIAAITSPEAIRKILTHLGLPAMVPKFIPP